jgi:FAD synthase
MQREHLAIEFWRRLRDEERYDSIEALVGAITDDVARTREIVPDGSLA